MPTWRRVLLGDGLGLFRFFLLWFGHVLCLCIAYSAKYIADAVISSMMILATLFSVKLFVDVVLESEGVCTHVQFVCCSRGVANQRGTGATVFVSIAMRMYRVSCCFEIQHWSRCCGLASLRREGV